MKCRTKYLLLLTAFAIGLGLTLPGHATAQTFTNLYNFTMISGGNSTNNDGASPSAGLVLYNNALFGTTLDGGQWGYGSIFKINLDGSGFINLHSFASGTDGANPVASLIVTNNTLYGTTEYGGSTNGNGTIFKINADGTGYAILHTFSPNSDGAYPAGSLALAGSFLYGTASGGGTAGAGTMFRIITNGTAFLNLHNFSFITNGTTPLAGLVISGSTLYGTTSGGGASSEGTVFKINNDGTGFTTLHSFAGRILGTNSEGVEPASALVLSGNRLYGSAPYGGAAGFGTIFGINTDGTAFTDLHDFTGTTDGAVPAAGVILSANTLYGTTQNPNNASNSYGSVFSINVNGSAFTVLHPFSYPVAFTNSDGAAPTGSLILSNFTLYGTARIGGSASSGTVFDIPIHPPFFAGEIALNDSVYYLAFPNADLFGYYTYAYFPYLYHFDLGFEYFIDANDSQGGAYLYDFTSGHFWYTSPTYPFPYLYDFSLNAVLYYYPDTNNAGHYTTNPRYFFNFATHQPLTQ